MTSLPAAVLWDFDGTLVDTHPYWFAAESRLAQRQGGVWDETHSLRLNGLAMADMAAYMRANMGVALPAAEIIAGLVDDVVAQLHVAAPWRDGAVELLTAFRSAGVPCALVTLATRPLIDPVLAHLPPDTFAAVVDASRIAVPKPHPDAYLTAAAALGVEPRDCLAIEDSEPGVASAEAAGCTVLVVPNRVPVAAGPRRVQVRTMVGLTPYTIARLIGT